MKLFYIDESGNTGKDLASASEPIHWLVALGVTEHAAHGIETDLLGVATKYFGVRANAPDFELHGVHIFGGRGETRRMEPAVRVRLYGDILRVLARHGSSLWVRGIHKARHAERAAEKFYTPDHPYKLAFMYLVESLDRWLADQQPGLGEIAAGAQACLGILISDEQDEVSRDLVSGFARWRQFGTDHGYRTLAAVRYLIDTIHYVKSQDSWLIQLVDCVAFIRNRHQKNLVKVGFDDTKFGESERAIADLWAQYCQPLVIDERIWPQ